MDLVFVDTETLGLDVAAPVWEFAAMRCRTDGTIIDGDGFMIDHEPGDWLATLDDPFASDYRNRYRRDHALPPQYAARAIEWITRGAMVLGSNPDFDMLRLGNLLEDHGFTPSWHYHPMDIPTFVHGYLVGQGRPPAPPWKSNGLSEALGVDPAAYNRHTAMGDVLWCHAQYQRVTAGVLV